MASNRPTKINVSDMPDAEQPEVLETIKDISDLRHKVLRKYDRFLTDVSNKRLKLEDSRKYQQFLLDADEIEKWLREKIDEPYGQGPLETQISDKNNFENVVNNHAKVIQNFEDAGMAMINERHFASHKIRVRLDEVQNLWEKLKQKLNHQESGLRKNFDELIRDIEREQAWIKEKEPFVASTNRGRDYFGVRNLIKRHEALVQEIKNHQPNIEAINVRCEKAIEAGLFADQIEPKVRSLNENWANLLTKADQRRAKLLDSVQAHQYLADASEAESWMREKEPIIKCTDFGKDEDSTESLLKKHEALMADVEAFNSTIKALGNQASACRVKELSVSDGMSKETAFVLSDYEPKSAREMAVKKGQVVTILSALHREWWKVEVNDRQGFVPAACLKRMAATSSPNQVIETYNIPQRQKQIEEYYQSLLDHGRTRLEELKDSVKAFQLVREAADLTQWIKDKEQFAKIETVGDNLEQVEVLQKKFDDFQKDMKDNRVRLRDLNNVAEHFKTLGQAEAANRIAEQIDDLNSKWDELERMAQKRRDQLGSTHEVQRFQRESDDTLDWIAEKDEMLNSNDYGHDLRSVLALQRKHEGLESDLLALSERIKQLNETAKRLKASDPAVEAKQRQINQEWDKVVDKANSRKLKLIDSHNLQRLLSDQKDMKAWMDATTSAVKTTETAPDVTGVEALMHRNEEIHAEIDVRAPKLKKLEDFGRRFIASNHYASSLIEEKLEELDGAKVELKNAWLARKELLEQNLILALYYRDCEQAESWMANRESFLQQENKESSDSVDNLIKKHEDFDKALASQETKINNLTNIADTLINSNHYAHEDIQSKRQEILDRWASLKEAMIKMRAKLNESRTLQQFSRDADEVESWIQEKQAVAVSNAPHDSSNIQAKSQKQQALEAELKANADRIKAVLDSGRKLIESQACGDTEDAVEERLKTIDEQFKQLASTTQEKSFVLKEATQLRSFNAAYKDFDFWLSQVEGLVKNEDYGNDLASVLLLIKMHTIIEHDIKAHEERIHDLNVLADDLIQSNQFDSDTIDSKRRATNERYERLVNLAIHRGNKLNEMKKLHKCFRDILDVESWIHEKKILVSSDDYGRDLAGVKNLQKKHKRLDSDITAYTPNVKAIQEHGQKVMAESSVGISDIEKRLQNLEQNWVDLIEMSAHRDRLLDESLEYQEFLSKIDEEEAWIREKQQLLTNPDNDCTMSSVQGLLKKHDTLETEFTSHYDRITNLDDEGQKLINKGNHHSEGIITRLNLLKDRSNNLDAESRRKKEYLTETYNTLQFMWKADVVDSWIGDKDAELKSDDQCRDLQSVKSSLAKQARFDACLDAFEQEGIASITHDRERAPMNFALVSKRYDEVMKRWNDLRALSDARKVSLNRMMDQFKQIEEHFLTFAKRASAFNSWFENAEEDLTDPVTCNSVEEARALSEAHAKFQQSLSSAQEDFDYLTELNRRIEYFKVGPNPYTWFVMKDLDKTWKSLKEIVAKRDRELAKERKRQEENDWLRKQFAKKANSLFDYIKETRMWLLAECQGQTNSLEQQLEACKKKVDEIRSRKGDVETIESLGKLQETNLIFDNRYTEHSTTALAQQWDQLEFLALRMQHHLELQIQARNHSGVSEDALREFSIMFKYFDKDNTGRLNHAEFKNCLRALGYDLPIVEENEPDPEFDAILNAVDPDRDGQVSLQEYMAFLISRETENVQSCDEIEQAFKAITLNGDKPYLTREELFSNLRSDVAEYCAARMDPYPSMPNCYDYSKFTRRVFVN